MSAAGAANEGMSYSERDLWNFLGRRRGFVLNCEAEIGEQEDLKRRVGSGRLD